MTKSLKDRIEYRNQFKRCVHCGEHMIGILKLSDKGHNTAPRQICVHCEDEFSKSLDDPDGG